MQLSETRNRKGAVNTDTGRDFKRKESDVQVYVKNFENFSEMELSTNICLTNINSRKYRTPEWINK